MLAHFVSFEGYVITIYYIIINSCAFIQVPYDMTCAVLSIGNVLTMLYIYVCYLADDRRKDVDEITRKHPHKIPVSENVVLFEVDD